MAKDKEPTAIAEYIASKDEKRFYASSEWRRTRKEALQRDRFECTLCKRNGKYTRAQTVHHVKYLREFPHLGLSLDNLMSLCHNCHDNIHERRRTLKKLKVFLPERW